MSHFTTMNANDVIIDLLEDTRRRLRRFLSDLSDDCLHWSPDGEANSIAVTVWHMGRLFDVFLTRQTKGEPAANECWFRLGWAEKTRYDPRGIGRNGWGSVNGYTLAEVAAIPRFTKEQLLAYFDDVHNAVKGFVAATPIDDLLTKAPGFDGRFSQYQIIQMALMDNGRHLGEIYALKTLWGRRQKNAI